MFAYILSYPASCLRSHIEVVVGHFPTCILQPHHWSEDWERTPIVGIELTSFDVFLTCHLLKLCWLLNIVEFAWFLQVWYEKVLLHCYRVLFMTSRLHFPVFAFSNPILASRQEFKFYRIKWRRLLWYYLYIDPHHNQSESRYILLC